MHRLVEHGERAAARLRPLRFRHTIACQKLIRKANAVGVNENGAIAANVFRKQRCGSLLNRRMHLNLINVHPYNIYSFCTDIICNLLCNCF